MFCSLLKERKLQFLSNQLESNIPAHMFWCHGTASRVSLRSTGQGCFGSKSGGQHNIRLVVIMLCLICGSHTTVCFVSCCRFIFVCRNAAALTLTALCGCSQLDVTRHEHVSQATVYSCYNAMMLLTSIISIHINWWLPHPSPAAANYPARLQDSKC